MTSQFQLDPPESALMSQKRISLAMFGNEESILESRMYDGVFLTVMQDIISRVMSGDLTLIVPPSDEISPLTQSISVVQPHMILENKYSFQQLISVVK